MQAVAEPQTQTTQPTDAWQHPDITIFVAFTRKWAVDDWLEQLAKVKHNPANTSICLLIDTDEPYILVAFRKFVEKYGYKDFQFKMNDNHFPNEVRLSTRRTRIAFMKNQSKHLIRLTEAEYILAFEDDTVLDRIDSFDRLLKPLIEDKGIGFVQGVQVGRWGVRIVGAWNVNNAANPTHAETLFPSEGYQELSAGGFYGYATRRSLYLNHEYYSSSDQPWGPDVNYGLWLQQRGYKCLIDWETNFGHNDHNKIAYIDTYPLAKVIYSKNTINGIWERTDEQKT